MVEISDSTKILDIKKIRSFTTTLSKLGIQSCQRKERDWAYDPGAWFTRQKDFVTYHGMSLKAAKDLVERLYEYDKNDVWLSKRSKYY